MKNWKEENAPKYMKIISTSQSEKENFSAMTKTSTNQDLRFNINIYVLVQAHTKNPAIPLLHHTITVSENCFWIIRFNQIAVCLDAHSS